MNYLMWQESSVISGNCNKWIYRDFSLYGQYKPASLQLGIAVNDAEPHGILIRPLEEVGAFEQAELRCIRSRSRAYSFVQFVPLARDKCGDSVEDSKGDPTL